MRIIQRFARKVLGIEERSFFPVNGGVPLSQMGSLLVGMGDGEFATVNEQTAMSLSAVYACVGIKARTIATIPFKLYRRKDDWGNVAAREHPLYDLVHTEPNPHMTSDVFRRYMMECKELSGNAFAWIERNFYGDPVALWPYPWWRTRLERKKDGIWYWFGDNPNPVPMEDVWHWRGRTYDGVTGISPIAELSIMFGGAIEAQRFGRRFWKNSAVPGGALEHPAKLSAEARESIRKEFRELYGDQKQHSVAVFQEGMTYKAIGIPPEHAQFLETRKFSVEEICRVFNVPPHMVQHLEKATFCLPGDSQIYTSNGPKPIKKIKAGEMVWSYDGQGIRLSRVKASVCSGEDELLEIRSTNRKLRCNAGHRVLVRRKYSVPKSGQGGYQNIEWKNEYIPAGELQIGDTLVVLDGLPDQGSDQCPTRKVSVGFMEFCGLLLGDGNVDPKSGVRIARADNALYMDYYRDVMQEEFVSFSRHGNGSTRNIPTLPVAIREAERSTVFSSRLAAEELEELGFCGNAYSKQVPEWVFSLNETLRLAFLRGYLDADGTVDKKGRISFHSVSRKMLTQMWHLCVGLGIPVTNFRAQDVNTTLPNGKKIQSLIYTFTCSDPGANRRIDSHDPRYVERLASGKPFQRKARNYPRFGGKDFNIDHCSISRISSIKKLPSEAVYDLQVEETESFIADGVVVHNSNIEHQSIDFVTHCIRPEAVHIEMTGNVRLLKKEERQKYYIELDLDGLLRGDYPTRMQGHVQGVANGIMNRNTVTQIENLPPLPPEIGDMYTVQLAMADMRGLVMQQGNPEADPAPKPEPEPELEEEEEEEEARDGKKKKEVRAGVQPMETRLRKSNERKRIRSRFAGIFREAGQRLIKREVQQIRKGIKENFAERSRGVEMEKRSEVEIQAFITWLERWREEHETFASKGLESAIFGLGQLIGESAAGEVDSDLNELDAFLAAYAEVFGKRRAGYVENRIKKLLENAEPGLELDAVEAELDIWEVRQAQRIADEEVVRLSGAVQAAVWTVAGFALQWVTAGDDPCPLCQEMNGKIVGRGQSFVPSGGTVKGNDKTGDLVVKSNIGHPPLHTGCDCDIIPS